MKNRKDYIICDGVGVYVTHLGKRHFRITDWPHAGEYVGYPRMVAVRKFVRQLYKEGKVP